MPAKTLEKVFLALLVLLVVRVQAPALKPLQLTESRNQSRPILKYKYYIKSKIDSLPNKCF